MIVLEQSAEAGLASDFFERDNRRFVFVVFFADQAIADSLMWSAVVIVRNILGDDVIEVAEGLKGRKILLKRL